MDEQKLQFRVGLFVLASLAVTAVLIVRFRDVGILSETLPHGWVAQDFPDFDPGNPCH